MHYSLWTFVWVSILSIFSIAVLCACCGRLARRYRERTSSNRQEPSDNIQPPTVHSQPIGPVVYSGPVDSSQANPSYPQPNAPIDPYSQLNSTNNHNNIHSSQHNNENNRNNNQSYATATAPY